MSSRKPHYTKKVGRGLEHLVKFIEEDLVVGPLRDRTIPLAKRRDLRRAVEWMKQMVKHEAKRASKG